MNKFSKFTIFFTLLTSTTLTASFLTLTIENLVEYTQATTEPLKSVCLSLVFNYFAFALISITIGFVLSCILHQLINIAYNTQKNRHRRKID